MDKVNEKLVMPHEGYVRLPAILVFLSIGKTAFYSGIKAGIFPQPIKLTKRTSVWKAQDIRKIVDGE